jgi:hypothetical protein
MRQTLKSMPQVVEELGWTYGKVLYAVRYKRVVEPMIVGRCRLFTQAQIQTLKTHFASMNQPK